MPTRSESPRNSEFGAGASPPRRSVFGNYKPKPIDVPVSGGEPSEDSARIDVSGAAPAGPGASSPFEGSIDTAFARAFLYRLLAKAYEDPEPEGWQWLTGEPARTVLGYAVQALAPAHRGAFAAAADALAGRLEPGAFDGFHEAYVACFGHTVRGDCPMNEIEYGDIKADPLFQPHRLADLGAFYAAFGLELTPDAAERQDHISIELEFMSVLAAKEAYAIEHSLEAGLAALCREAQRKFLREHLGRWAPAFTRRLARMSSGTVLGALAELTREFISEDCARFLVTPGSEDLLLRPIDESSESFCASCGITNLPPGAACSARES